MISPGLPITLSVLVAAGALSFPSEQPAFESAYLEEAQICFDSPLPVDWDSLAHKYFTQFPLAHPDIAAIRAGYREIYGGTSSFRYFAPLPRELSVLHYYLFSERGVHPLRPTRLRGEVMYSLGKEREILRPPAIHGVVCAPADASTHDAGFIAISTEPMAWRTTAVPVDNQPSASYVRLRSGKVRVPPSDVSISSVRAAYIATAERLGQSYLFVRRAPDDHCQRMCCTYAYDLFLAGSALRSLKWTAYACDS